MVKLTDFGLAVMLPVCLTRVTSPKGAKTRIFFEYLAASAAKYRENGVGPPKKGRGPVQNGQGVIGKPILGF